MSESPPNQLIKMINQIASNLSVGEQGSVTETDAVIAQKVADHLTRFWARSMKLQIIAAAKTSREQLSTTALAAIERLETKHQ